MIALWFLQNLDYFHAKEGSEVWERYLDYVDEIVVDGLFNCIQCSLRYLMENTDKTVTGMTPLLEVKLELQVRVFVHVNLKCYVLHS